jgi:beta-1,4-mannosyltransferase
MFGCGLPVAAKSCPALHELVINGINGMIFDSAEELADQVRSSLVEGDCVAAMCWDVSSSQHKQVVVWIFKKGPFSTCSIHH